jgi:hypothetical protein
MQIGDQFPSIGAAKHAIKQHTLDDGESFRVLASDKKRYLIAYKKSTETACKFRICVTQSSSKGTTSITVLVPYSYSPITHYNNRQLHSILYLKDHYCALVIENRWILPKQIIANERLYFRNTINYLQAHRVK